jgi:hypothetical protein
MSIKIKTAALTAGFALAAVPAYGAGQQPSQVPPGYDGSANPGSQYQPSSTPPTYNGTNNPGSTQQSSQNQNNSQPTSFPGQANPPSRAKAVGLQCLKQNFLPNTSAFRDCVKAGVAAIRASHTESAKTAAKSSCKTQHFHGKPASGEHRSAYGACVAAALSSIKSTHHS